MLKLRRDEAKFKNRAEPSVHIRRELVCDKSKAVKSTFIKLE